MQATKARNNGVACYLRVSSRSQSIESQKLAVTRCLESNGIDPDRVWWVIDDGISGATMNRPAFMSLDQAVDAERIRTVVMYALDRLARTALEGIQLLHRWLEKDIRIVVVTTPIDLSGRMGQMVASILFYLAQYERERLLERQAAGLEVARAKHAKAWKLFDLGHNAEYIALEIGEKLERVKKILACRDTLWYVNHLGRKRSKIDMKHLGELLAKGLSVRQASRTIKRDIRTVYRRINECGGIEAVIAGATSPALVVD